MVDYNAYKDPVKPCNKVVDGGELGVGYNCVRMLVGDAGGAGS